MNFNHFIGYKAVNYFHDNHGKFFCYLVNCQILEFALPIDFLQECPNFVYVSF